MERASAAACAASACSCMIATVRLLPSFPSPDAASPSSPPRPFLSAFCAAGFGFSCLDGCRGSRRSGRRRLSSPPLWTHALLRTHTHTHTLSLSVSLVGGRGMGNEHSVGPERVACVRLGASVVGHHHAVADPQRAATERGSDLADYTCGAVLLTTQPYR